MVIDSQSYSLIPLSSSNTTKVFHNHLITITPINHYRTPWVCRVPETLGKRQKTLGKWFAECNTWRTALAKNSDGKANFAECLLSGTRQSLCRVPDTRQSWHWKKTRKNGNFYPKKWNFFLIGGGPTGQRPPISGIFRVNIAATRPTGFEPAPSPYARTSSTTTPHCHLCLDSVLVPNILY